MTTKPKTILLLAAALLLGAAGVSACTAEEEPTPGATGVPSQTALAPSDAGPGTGIPGEQLTLITNVGTPEAPIGSSSAATTYSFNARLLQRKGSVIFVSDAVDLPGGNGNVQVYRWTPELGIILITNVSSDPTRPVGANGYSMPTDANRDGTEVVFVSDAPDLPNGNGNGHIYRWSATDGMTFIYDTDRVNEGKGTPFYPYWPLITDDGAVEFEVPHGKGMDDDYAVDFEFYRWTVLDGLVVTPLHIAIPSPFSKDGYPLYLSLPDGSIVFISLSTSLPGGNGHSQIYRRTDTGEVTLITNAGTADAPVGATSESFSVPVASWWNLNLLDDGTLVFGSYAKDLPGGNGHLQQYLWTIADGLSLISNVGSAAAPVGANADVSFYYARYFNGAGYSTPVPSLTEGQVVFESRATDLPGGNGETQIYLWTPADGLTLITNAGTPIAPVGATGSQWWTTVLTQFGGDGALIRDSDAASLLGGVTAPPACPDVAQLYLWTPADGLALVTNAGTSDVPVGSCGGYKTAALLSDGSVVFTSTATDLPGGNGNLQIYRWRPPQ
jgi:hypothetical protein